MGLQIEQSIMLPDLVLGPSLARTKTAMTEHFVCNLCVSLLLCLYPPYYKYNTSNFSMYVCMYVCTYVPRTEKSDFVRLFGG